MANLWEVGETRLVEICHALGQHRVLSTSQVHRACPPVAASDDAKKALRATYGRLREAEQMGLVGQVAPPESTRRRRARETAERTDREHRERVDAAKRARRRAEESGEPFTEPELEPVESPKVRKARLTHGKYGTEAIWFLTSEGHGRVMGGDRYERTYRVDPGKMLGPALAHTLATNEVCLRALEGFRDRWTFMDHRCWANEVRVAGGGRKAHFVTVDAELVIDSGGGIDDFYPYWIEMDRLTEDRQTVGHKLLALKRANAAAVAEGTGVAKPVLWVVGANAAVESRSPGLARQRVEFVKSRVAAMRELRVWVATYDDIVAKGFTGASWQAPDGASLPVLAKVV